MALENNPLRQYFRRPAIYLRLPSGGNYPQGVIRNTETGELPVYPMTAIDEIATKTPDALFNGQAVVDIIKSCVPDIIDPWRISSADLDSILIAIRAASNGNNMEINSLCPKCDEDAKYDVNLAGILANMGRPDYTKELEIGEMALKFRPLTYREMNEVNLSQFDLQRNFIAIEQIEDVEEKTRRSREALAVITKVTMNTIAKTIEYIRTPSAMVTETEFILDFIENCDKTMYELIRDYNADLRSQSESKPMKIKCIHCQHDYEQPFTFNVTDFFE